MKSIKLHEITNDAALQVRVTHDEPTISQYSELMTEGVKFPPVTLWSTDGQLITIDGYHRIEAAKMSGFCDIAANVVHAPDKFEALKMAAELNRAHGLKMSSADKRNAIAKLLSASPETSNLAIAECVGCSDHTVKAVRDVLGAAVKPATIKDKRGHDRPATVSRAGKAKEPSDRDDEKEQKVQAEDVGLGGDHLSPETISKAESPSQKMTRDEVVTIIDDCIDRLTRDEYKTRAANLMRVKVWVMGK